MFQINGSVLAAVALDGEFQDILRQAHDLARSYRVELHVCHVLPEIFAVRPLFPHLHLDDALNLAQLEAAVRSRILECVRIETGRESAKVGITIEQGTVHAGILRAAERLAAGAIVVGGKRDDNGLPMLGDTAGPVVRYAHCPVLVARPSPEGKVLAATDFSDPSLPAVEAGEAEARRRKADLTIIHALEPFPPILHYLDGISPGVLPVDLGDQMMESQQKWLDESVRRFEAKGGGLLRPGPPARAILSAASELPAELVVVGTHGRTGLSRLALGNVAEGVVSQAPCSVLVVRLTEAQSQRSSLGTPILGELSQA